MANQERKIIEVRSPRPYVGTEYIVIEYTVIEPARELPRANRNKSYLERYIEKNRDRVTGIETLTSRHQIGTWQRGGKKI